MSTADHQAQAWWAQVTWDDARCDLAARMSEIEIRMLARTGGVR